MSFSLAAGESCKPEFRETSRERLRKSHAVPLEICRPSGVSETAFQMDEQHGNRRGRDAGNARSLTHSLRAVLIQLLLRLRRKPAHLAVIHIRRKAQIFVLRLTRDFFLLALDITLVFGLDLDLLAHPLVRHAGTGAAQGHQLRISDVRPSQKIRERVLSLQRLAEHPLRLTRREQARIDPARLEPLLLARYRFPLDAVRLPAAVIHRA